MNVPFLAGSMRSGGCRREPSLQSGGEAGRPLPGRRWRPGKFARRVGKVQRKNGRGPRPIGRNKKGKIFIYRGRGKCREFFSLYSTAEQKFFRYECGADRTKVKRRNFGEGGRRRQRRPFSALGRGRLLAETGRLPCRLKCGDGPRKGALFCRAVCGALSGAGMKQRGSIFIGIFKTGRPWDGRMQRAEACGKAAALCGEGTAAGRHCFAAGNFPVRRRVRGIFCGGRFVDTLCLFLYD